MVSDRKNKKRTAAVPVMDFKMLAEQHEAAESMSAKRAKKTSKKERVKTKVKEEVEDDEHEEHLEFWSTTDLNELFRKIEINIPPKDTLRFDSRCERFDWEAVKFGEFTAEQCKQQWVAIQKRLRRYRLLKELLDDAKVWVKQPWTNFYRSHKQNRHPDQPRRPLSTYMIFYLEKKDKVAKEHPNLEMTEVSKLIAGMYKNLSEKQKQKYIAKAAQQREEYELKLDTFYKMHPELVPKVVKREKSSVQKYVGPRKPSTPFQHFLTEKMEKHKNDPQVNKAALTEQYREQWRELADKKKVTWINVALEDETRYHEEIKSYQVENPMFVPSTLKPILTRDERIIKERSIGKPEKPPNSGYSLFSRIMLSSEEIKHVDSRKRMTQISTMWKNLNAKDKRKYHDKVQQMLEQYKLDFASYLEGLTPEQKEEELHATQRRRVKHPAPRKIPAPKVEPDADDDGLVPTSEDEDEPPPPKIKKVAATSSTTSKPTTKATKASKASTSAAADSSTSSMKLFKGEPEPPPVMAFKLFLRDFVETASHIPADNRVKEAPRYWQMLPDSEKAKYRKRLGEMKQVYIANYEKFLKSLTQEQLKEYSMRKKATAQQSEESAEDSGEDSDNASNVEEDDEGQQSDEVRVTGVVRTVSFPKLSPATRHGRRPHGTPPEESDSGGSSSGSASDTDSSSGSSGTDSDSDSD